MTPSPSSSPSTSNGRPQAGSTPLIAPARQYDRSEATDHHAAAPRLLVASLHDRHCERSGATQRRGAVSPGLLRRCAPRNDVGCVDAFLCLFSYLWRQGRGRLRPETVEQIRTLVETTTLTEREIARRLRVSTATISRLKREGGWGEPEGSARLLRRRGRPYPPELVAAVRALVEGTGLTYREIARRTGVSSAMACRWRRLHGWRRPEEAARPVHPGASGLRAARREARRQRRWEHRIRQESETGALGRQKPPRALRRPGRPYRADTIEAVRVLVVGSVLSYRVIAARTGICSETAWRWTRRHGWRRPNLPVIARRSAAARRTAPVATAGNRRGRPYAPEIRREARALWELTALPTALIAARLGLRPGTVSLWARREAWERPRGRPTGRQLRRFHGMRRRG